MSRMDEFLNSSLLSQAIAEQIASENRQYDLLHYDGSELAAKLAARNSELAAVVGLTSPELSALVEEPYFQEIFGQAVQHHLPYNEQMRIWEDFNMIQLPLFATL